MEHLPGLWLTQPCRLPCAPRSSPGSPGRPGRECAPGGVARGAAQSGGWGVEEVLLGGGGAGRAGRGQCRVWATWGRAPRKRARRPISYQSPAAPCVSVNKTNPFGGVTFAKNAALFRLKGKYVFQIWFLWLD